VLRRPSETIFQEGQSISQAQGKDASKSNRRKPKISAQGLRNIVEAQKKRWARVKAAVKSKGKVS